MDYVERIKKFALDKHQLMNRRYGGAPYSLHLELVVNKALQYIHYIDEAERDDVIAACWAHDLIEDTGVTLKEFQEISNGMIAHIVYCVSNELGKNRKERNFKTYPKIWSDPRAIFVKLCDRAVNGSYSKIHKPMLFERYCIEYPVFRYALYQEGQYEDLWKELDRLFNLI